MFHKSTGDTMIKTTTKFAVGQKLIFKPAAEIGHRFAAKSGAKATVGPRGFFESNWGSTFLDIVWDNREEHYQSNGGYHASDFILAEQPAKEPTAPMSKADLDLMRRKGAVTCLEAQGVLRCRSLPRRILDLKNLGHKIVTEMKLDPTGQKYARYHLQAA
jgi:hypothetical protein